jgi:hypothetical protein
MIFNDSETCGFHGPIVTIQYAEDKGPVTIHEVWRRPIRDTIQLLEWMMTQDLCGFNMAFDHFHYCQLWTTLMLMDDHHLEPDITEYAYAEPLGRDGKCLKPKGALDLMLHARKGKYQSTMDRGDIEIKRVPTALAYELARELNTRIVIKDIYFAKKADKTQRWQVMDITDDFGDMIPEFKNVVLKFAPSSRLKTLAIDALNLKEDEVLLYKDIDVPEQYRPVETGYAPFAMSGVLEKDRHNEWVVLPVDQNNWRQKWPQMIYAHITHWAHNPLARKYGMKDVSYLQELYDYFDRPAINDDDSVLACMVGAVRWRGFAIDIPYVRELKSEATKLLDPRFASADKCKQYLFETLSEDERKTMLVDGKTTTKGIILEQIAKWKISTVCDTCLGMDAGCHVCDGTGLVSGEERHLAAVRAEEILEARHAKKKIEVLDKLLMAGRFHASFNVIGALSSRMSGSDGLNAQGINHDKKVRKAFTLAWKGQTLCGGDFDGFEVSIVDAVYKDPTLHAELLTGKSIHGLLGVFFFPEHNYETLLLTKELAGEKNKYARSKNGTFALIYMGNEYTLHTRVGIPMEIAESAYQRFIGKYTKFGEERKRYADMFCSMRQPNGIGTAVEWHDPEDYISTMLGFRRYFTLENMVCKELFTLAEKPPKEWQNIKLRVVRRDRVQTACGAIRSALFAAAFNLQANNMRAAGNHVIQGTGSGVTKRLQAKLWEIQPYGINDWDIMPMNVHDEVMAPCSERGRPLAREIVTTFLEDSRSLIPLIGMGWEEELQNWSDKGSMECVDGQWRKKVKKGKDEALEDKKIMQETEEAIEQL